MLLPGRVIMECCCCSTLVRLGAIEGCTGTCQYTSPIGEDTEVGSTTTVCIMLMIAEGNSAKTTSGNEEIYPSGGLHADPSAWH
jgi:hypothetical protein